MAEREGAALENREGRTLSELFRSRALLAEALEVFDGLVREGTPFPVAEGTPVRPGPRPGPTASGMTAADRVRLLEGMLDRVRRNRRVRR